MEELVCIADKIRPNVEQAMKIEVAPWIRDYVVNMENLYTEVVLEKLDYKPTGEVRRVLSDYSELFTRADQEPDNPFCPGGFLAAKRLRLNDYKIVLKGDPGMGKTTLCKKIAWDWARTLFKEYHIVFFVYLKFVKPQDVIESIIIKQNPYIVGLNITERKIESILKTFGSKCLLILDGLDEHALGTNEDVSKIIRGEKCLDCNIIVTSRPHSTREIERYFPMIARVEGFTESKAEQFASKILQNDEKIAAVLKYNPVDFSQDVPIYKCPILLSFLCLLVREDDIDLSNTTIHIGEIYTRMVRCLFKKYLIRRELHFDAAQFETVLVSIGKLALKTLLSGDPLLQRSEVIREVGPKAFDYGLLIGHEDAHMLIKDETADIFVTCPHRSIQEFLGSLYLIWMLNKGEKMQSLLGVNYGKPIFLTNTLFLQFCLWFLRDDQTYFHLENRQKVYQCMKHVCVDLMNCGEIDLSNYPAFHSSSFNNIVKDKLRLSFLTDILVKCNKTSMLRLPSSSLLDSILGPISNILKDITSINCNYRKYNLNVFKGPELVINAFNDSSDDLNIIVKHYTRLINEPNVHLYLCNSMFQSEKILCPNVKSLYLSSLTEVREIFESSTKLNPRLTHFSIKHIENKAIMKREINKLANAVKKDSLLNLSHLAFLDCKKMEGKLSDLFKSTWPRLKHLDLKGTHISETDLEFLSLACNGVSKTLPNLTSLGLTIRDALKTCFCSKFFVLPWLNLESFHVDDQCADESLCQGLSIVTRDNKLPNLTCLTIGTMCLESLNLCSDKLPNLKVLHLHAVFTSSAIQFPDLHLQKVMRTELLSELKLKLFSALGFKGNVFSLITSSPLGQLTTLILSDSNLNSDDLASLARAKVNGYLPLLKHLDISCYYSAISSDFTRLFDGPCTWNGLLSLSLDIGNRLKKKISTRLSIT